jgi:phenylacetate-coenzyme A ligase PaaK-like adenylate-forming protein
VKNDPAEKLRVDVLEFVSSGVLIPGEHQALLETFIRGADLIRFRTEDTASIEPGHDRQSGGNHASFFESIFGRFG